MTRRRRDDLRLYRLKLMPEVRRVVINPKFRISEEFASNHLWERSDVEYNLEQWRNTTVAPTTSSSWAGSSVFERAGTAQLCHNLLISNDKDEAIALSWVGAFLHDVVMSSRKCLPTEWRGPAYQLLRNIWISVLKYGADAGLDLRWHQSCCNILGGASSEVAGLARMGLVPKDGADVSNLVWLAAQLFLREYIRVIIIWEPSE